MFVFPMCIQRSFKEGFEITRKAVPSETAWARQKNKCRKHAVCVKSEGEVFIVQKVQKVKKYKMCKNINKCMK